MAVHLTPEQERRIQSLVDSGYYESTEQVVDAALKSVEPEVPPGWEGREEELARLLEEGENSTEWIEVGDKFWAEFESELDQMIADHEARKAVREA